MEKRTWLGFLTGVVVASWLYSRRSRFDWRGKVVVITGGARGLGLLLAREVVKRGGEVAICARDAEEVDRARTELATGGASVFGTACDVTDRDALVNFFAGVERSLGPIDVLINCAGIVQVGPMESMSTEDYESAMRLHFWAPLHAMHAVIPQMRRRHSGRIINISSIGAKVSIPHLLPYGASKFALYGLSTGMHAELAKDGIVITTVCPGLMRTGSPRHAQVKGRQAEEYAWFKLADSLPVLSMNADRAARQILAASARGDAEVVLSLPAKVLARAYALAPSFVQRLMGFVNGLLPSAEGGSVESVEGKDVELVPSFLTRLGDRAAQRNNEL